MTKMRGKQPMEKPGVSSNHFSSAPLSTSRPSSLTQETMSTILSRAWMESWTNTLVLPAVSGSWWSFNFWLAEDFSTARSQTTLRMSAWRSEIVIKLMLLREDSRDQLSSLRSASRMTDYYNSTTSGLPYSSFLEGWASFQKWLY